MVLQKFMAFYLLTVFMFSLLFYLKFYNTEAYGTPLSTVIHLIESSIGNWPKDEVLDYIPEDVYYNSQFENVKDSKI